ncbi:hypothetical protein D3C87_1750930 [compost metagenome]
MRGGACRNGSVCAGKIKRAHVLDRLIDQLFCLAHLDLEHALRLHVFEVVGEFHHAGGDGEIGLVGALYLLERRLVGVGDHERGVFVRKLAEPGHGFTDDLLGCLLLERRQRDQMPGKRHARVRKLCFQGARK